jgi:hypothetical protein
MADWSGQVTVRSLPFNRSGRIRGAEAVAGADHVPWSISRFFQLNLANILRILDLYITIVDIPQYICPAMGC